VGTEGGLSDQLRQHLRGVVASVAASPVIPSRYRWLLYRLVGARTRGSWISPGCWIDSPNLVVGERSFLNLQCFIDTSARVHIGADCALGPRVCIITSQHEIGPGSRRAGALRPQPVSVEDGCWIGAAATVLPGVTIGAGAVVAAGAVVVHDVAPDTLVAGVPARLVRALETAAPAADPLGEVAIEP